MNIYAATKWQTEEAIETKTIEDIEHHIIIWNDDVNTFDWVIQCLVEICHHQVEQAEQCALFIHFKGKYAVKSGSFDELRPMAEALIERGLSATID